MKKSIITKSLTFSLAIAAAITLPTAVKAAADNILDATTAPTTSAEQLNSELNWCVFIPGFGWLCG